MEITEGALLHDLSRAKLAVERIRSFGIGVSIDDFGTGFASFEYLQHLPLTGLKIDRAFVTDLEHSVRARKLISCMIDVGHALDMVVTAEGVETKASMTFSGRWGAIRHRGSCILRPYLPSATPLARKIHCRMNRSPVPAYSRLQVPGPEEVA